MPAFLVGVARPGAILCLSPDLFQLHFDDDVGVELDVTLEALQRSRPIGVLVNSKSNSFKCAANGNVGFIHGSGFAESGIGVERWIRSHAAAAHHRAGDEAGLGGEAWTDCDNHAVDGTSWPPLSSALSMRNKRMEFPLFSDLDLTTLTLAIRVEPFGISVPSVSFTGLRVLASMTSPALRLLVETSLVNLAMMTGVLAETGALAAAVVAA